MARSFIALSHETCDYAAVSLRTGKNFDLTAPEVDLAAHPDTLHPLDPFGGSLITRLMDDRPHLVVADRHVLVGCDVLWDILANQALFDGWCQLVPPKLDVKVQLSTVGAALLGVPTNRPTRVSPMAMCKDWTMRFSMAGRPLTYRIGNFRPSLNVMEASRL